MKVLERFQMDGRVAIVTGGSRGLGFAAACALAEAGATVVIGSRDEHSLEDAAADIAAASGHAVDHHVLDVGDPTSVDVFFEHVRDHHGAADVLVNNAGTEHSALAADTEIEDWNHVLGINLTGPFACARAFMRIAAEADASIINIASIGALVGVPTQVAYCATKAGVTGMSRALALELAPRGIRVNAIAPGYFRTDMPAQVINHPNQLEKLLKKVPQRRIADTEEIGPLIVYLASPASSFVTGATIAIDGGYTAQ